MKSACTSAITNFHFLKLKQRVALKYRNKPCRTLYIYIYCQSRSGQRSVQRRSPQRSDVFFFSHGDILYFCIEAVICLTALIALISCWWLLWCCRMCVCLCGGLVGCGQCYVTRHEISPLVSGVSASPTKGGGRAACVHTTPPSPSLLIPPFFRLERQVEKMIKMEERHKILLIKSSKPVFTKV